MNSKDIQLSKSLSWLLRHAAVKEGFDLSPEGYIDIEKILNHKSFKQYSSSDIKRVVRNNEKQRFRLRLNQDTGVTEIKANQGHSIDKVTDVELTPILTAKYPTVVHGTFTNCWPQIKQIGLSRMLRHHIHFAKGLNTDRSIISGLRNNAQIHIYVNLSKALEDGIKFYESDNGVILTPGNDNGFLETKYFDRVIEVATG
ncbi:tRNA 2'-phosphotransferase 1 [Cydia fagiglandana]|uniref:tRNA 2'-phosphotransferase 1 n=1 Tax=Cydia fagiglandana TaxID=1458189 RepID=UPI002FEE0239